MKKSIRISAVILCLVITLSALSGCGVNEARVKISTKLYSKMKFTDEALESGVVAENEHFSLTWNDELSQVFFTDKQSGEIYGSMPYEATIPVYDEDGMLIGNNKQVESPITVFYYEYKSVSEAYSHASVDAIEEGNVYTEKIENGLRVIYDFCNQEISVPVEYTISDECFNITVKPTEISDNGERYVTAVSIAPFACGLKNDSENSSLFLPDGSGAIIKPISKNITGNSGSMRVYGEDLTVQTYNKKSYTQTVKMPVFGMQKGGNALFGIITSAAEQASINWNIGASSIRYSTVYPMFRIRGYSLLESPKGFASTAIEIKAFDDIINDTPLSVSYFPLNGEKANYSGMAELYRNYLLKNGTLKKKSTETPAASLKIIGGVEQKEFTFGIPHTVLKPLTTIEQAEEITRYFEKKTDGKILVNLVGFGASGLDTGKAGGGFKIAGKLGSKKTVKKLADYCKINGIELFYSFDLIAYSKSGSGFSLTSDSAKLINGQTAFLNNNDNMTRNKGANRYALLSRGELENALKRAIKATDGYEIGGISLDSIGNTLYSDYGINGAGVGENMGVQAKKLLDKAGEKHTVLLSGANSYAFGSCDYITEAPTSSSKYDFTAYDVPFYQMVVRGYVPLAGESINLAVNGEKAILRCVETGIAPSYTLIYDYDSTLATSEFYNLYGSSYKGIREDAIKNINRLSGVFEIIGDKTIKSHSVLDNGLRITEFDGGVTVAVNETDTEQSVNGKTIPAMDYAVWEG